MHTCNFQRGATLLSPPICLLLMSCILSMICTAESIWAISNLGRCVYHQTLSIHRGLHTRKGMVFYTYVSGQAPCITAEINSSVEALTPSSSCTHHPSFHVIWVKVTNRSRNEIEYVWKWTKYFRYGVRNDQQKIYPSLSKSAGLLSGLGNAHCCYDGIKGCSLLLAMTDKACWRE